MVWVYIGTCVGRFCMHVRIHIYVKEEGWENDTRDDLCTAWRAPKRSTNDWIRIVITTRSYTSYNFLAIFDLWSSFHEDEAQLTRAWYCLTLAQGKRNLRIYMWRWNSCSTEIIYDSISCVLYVENEILFISQTDYHRLNWDRKLFLLSKHAAHKWFCCSYIPQDIIDRDNRISVNLSSVRTVIPVDSLLPDKGIHHVLLYCERNRIHR